MKSCIVRCFGFCVFGYFILLLTGVTAATVTPKAEDQPVFKETSGKDAAPKSSATDDTAGRASSGDASEKGDTKDGATKTGVDLNGDSDLTNSCLNLINASRAKVSTSDFPAFTVESSLPAITLNEAELKSKFCTAADGEAAKSAVEANILFFKQKHVVKVEACDNAVNGWYTSGQADIASGNPPAYSKASPAPFYRKVVNIGFAGMLFGKLTVPSGTGTLSCASFNCSETTTKQFAVVCQISTSPSKFIAEGSAIWTEKEYEAIEGIVSSAETASTVVSAGIVGSCLLYLIIL